MRGIGIDITPVERIAAIDSRYPSKFRQRILAPGENPPNAETLAGLWAAKEAVSKAMGTGFRQFGPKDVVIQHDAFGAPAVVLLPDAEKVARSRGIVQILVSISHAGGLAVACAVALGAHIPE